MKWNNNEFANCTKYFLVKNLEKYLKTNIGNKAAQIQALFDTLLVNPKNRGSEGGG